MASQWTETDNGLEISIAAVPEDGPDDGHDVTLELLLCFGQALWTKLNHSQRKAWWLLLDGEIGAGVAGEIDEDALKQKKLLLAGRYSASSNRRLELYGAASFAGTVAEYVHSLWHDVTVRLGREFLPAQQLKRRLDLLARWFPRAGAIGSFRSRPVEWHQADQLFFEVMAVNAAAFCSVLVLPQDGHLALCANRSAMWRISVNSLPQSRQAKT